MEFRRAIEDRCERRQLLAEIGCRPVHSSFRIRYSVFAIVPALARK
jgi:hypothetical protein